MPSLVEIKVHPPSGTIVLNRPDKRNALSRMALFELRQALSDLHQERQVRAVILTGAGDAFSAGMDLEEMHSTSQQDDAQQQWYQDAIQYRDAVELMLQFPKPMIAAVHGPALAGGVGLVLSCDVVIASPQATLGMPEPRRGLVAGLVAPQLVFRIGGGHAARLLLTGEPIDAAEAHRIGLVHELVPADQLWVRAHQLAEQCARCAPEALQLTRRLLNETIGEHLGTMLTSGAAASATSRTTEAAQEGISAFLEKREPHWP